MREKASLRIRRICIHFFCKWNAEHVYRKKEKVSKGYGMASKGKKIKVLKEGREETQSR